MRAIAPLAPKEYRTEVPTSYPKGVQHDREDET